MRYLLVVCLLGLGACDSGPSEENLEQAKSDKSCGKLYSSLTKVLQDELYKNGVSEVKFGEKAGFVEKCAAAALTDEQLKCLDPNLGGTEACKETLAKVEEKTKGLHDFLLAPMTQKPEEAAAPAGG